MSETKAKKIVLNAYQYAPTITGTDRMAYNFLTELQKLDGANQYYVLCSTENYTRSAISAQNFRVIRPPRVPVRFFQRVVNKLWRTFLPHIIKTLKANTYFSFHNMRLPHMRVATRMIASNLDLIPLKFPEYAELEPSFESEARQTVQLADHFMAISEFSKAELCELLSVDRAKVTAIPLAADPQFATKESESKIDLPQNFILTMGGSEPRKNVRTVIAAYNALPEKLRAQYPLLIAGGNWHGKIVNDLVKGSRATALGYVSDDDLKALYDHASTFVYASTYEGFGFTILEAMACDVPVVTSNATSLAEVAGQAALLFEPNDTATLTKLLQSVLTDENEQKRLRTAGQKQAQKFSWQQSARLLHGILLG